MFGLGKAKQEAWTGVVTKKGTGADVDEDGTRTRYYVLEVTRDDNRKMQRFHHIPQAFFNSFEEGDKVVSPAGSKTIEKAAG